MTYIHVPSLSPLKELFLAMGINLPEEPAAEPATRMLVCILMFITQLK